MIEKGRKRCCKATSHFPAFWDSSEIIAHPVTVQSSFFFYQQSLTTHRTNTAEEPDQLTMTKLLSDCWTLSQGYLKVATNKSRSSVHQKEAGLFSSSGQLALENIPAGLHLTAILLLQGWRTMSDLGITIYLLENLWYPVTNKIILCISATLLIFLQVSQKTGKAGG